MQKFSHVGNSFQMIWTTFNRQEKTIKPQTHPSRKAENFLWLRSTNSWNLLATRNTISPSLSRFFVICKSRFLNHICDDNNRKRCGTTPESGVLGSYSIKSFLWCHAPWRLASNLVHLLHDQLRDLYRRLVVWPKPTKWTEAVEQPPLKASPDQSLKDTNAWTILDCRE